jgi:hypothetical protein
VQLEVKLHKLICLAYEKGYRVTEEGLLLGIKGERKITVPPSGQYPRFTFRCGFEFSKDGSYGIPVHMFAAYCFHGAKLFEDGIEVRHLNANILDISKDNITLGTRQENEADKTKETRKKVGKINSMKRKGVTPTNAKFTKDQVIDIKNRILNGESNSSIARSYRTHRNNIRNIKIGESYSNIKIGESYSNIKIQEEER